MLILRIMIRIENDNKIYSEFINFHCLHIPLRGLSFFHHPRISNKIFGNQVVDDGKIWKCQYHEQSMI